MRALVAGDNCVDRYLPPIGRDFVGGQAVNVAAGLAALHVETAYAGVVGDDPAGAWITHELRRRGVDTELVGVAPGSTGVTDIEVTPEGERLFLAERYGVSAPYVPTPDACRLAGAVDLVYVAHVEPLEPLAAALGPRTELALDASEGDLDPALLRRATILFKAAPELEPDDALALGESILAMGPRVVVLTMGSSGSVVVAADGARATCPADARTVIDTLGAGDALAAGFLAARLRGMSYETALQVGRDAAAIACSHLGALGER